LTDPDEAVEVGALRFTGFNRGKVVLLDLGT
jgi:hypothetical protein